jgi:hypothetical protein
MTPPPQGGFDGLQLLTHPFFDRSSFDDAPRIPVALATNMHTPQALTGLWRPLSSLLPVRDRQPTTRDQSGLGRGQGEAKSAEPCGQLVFAVRRLVLRVQPQHEIIGKARDEDIACGPLLTPGMTPAVKDIMQGEVRHPGTEHQSLGTPSCRLRLLPSGGDDIQLKPLIAQA